MILYIFWVKSPPPPPPIVFSLGFIIYTYARVCTHTQTGAQTRNNIIYEHWRTQIVCVCVFVSTMFARINFVTTILHCGGYHGDSLLQRFRVTLRHVPGTVREYYKRTKYGCEEVPSRSAERTCRVDTPSWNGTYYSTGYPTCCVRPHAPEPDCGSHGSHVQVVNTRSGLTRTFNARRKIIHRTLSVTKFGKGYEEHASP